MSVKGAMYAVADNSGAKKVKLIGLLGGSKHRTPQVADLITVAVQEAIPRSRVKEGEVHRAVVVATVQTVRRPDGTCVRFPDNRVVILNPQREPIGTRVLGCVARELRQNFLKIISLAEEVV